MLVIGLAGGIGTGKSKIAGLLQTLGAAVIEADGVAREAVEPGTAAYQGIIARFGAEVVNPDGSLNRQLLGQKVFSDPRARKTLEAITHPWIRSEMARRVEQLRKQKEPPPAVFLELPLLVARDTPVAMDEVWVVTATVETRIARVQQRDGLTEAEIADRMAAQPDPEDLLRLADAVIDNDGAWSQTEERVSELWQQRVLSAAGTAQQNKQKGGSDSIESPTS